MGFLFFVPPPLFFFGGGGARVSGCTCVGDHSDTPESRVTRVLRVINNT